MVLESIFLCHLVSQINLTTDPNLPIFKINVINDKSCKEDPRPSYRVVSHVDSGQTSISDGRPDSFGDARARDAASQLAPGLRRCALLTAKSLGTLGAKPLLNRNLLQGRGQALQVKSNKNIRGENVIKRNASYCWKRISRQSIHMKKQRDSLEYYCMIYMDVKE